MPFLVFFAIYNWLANEFEAWAERRATAGCGKRR